MNLQIVFLLPSYVSTLNSTEHLRAGVSGLAYRKCSKWLIRQMLCLPHAQLPNCHKFYMLLVICEINGDRDHRFFSCGNKQVRISKYKCILKKNTVQSPDYFLHRQCFITKNVFITGSVETQQRNCFHTSLSIYFSASNSTYSFKTSFLLPTVAFQGNFLLYF